MDPREDLEEELEEQPEELEETPEEVIPESDEEVEEVQPEEETYEEPVYQNYSSPFDQVRDNVRQNIKNRLQNRRNKTDENIKDRINKGRQQNQQQKSVRNAKKAQEEIAKKTKDEAAKKAAKKTAEQGAKKAAGEGAKKAAGEAAKAAAQAIGAALKAAAQAIGSAVSSALAALVANPYFWAVVGVIVLVIVIIVLFVVLFAAINDGSNSNQNNNANNSKEMGSLMSLTHTKYTKDEFVAACDAQADSTSDTIIKNFYAKCGDIYTIAIDNGVNPEVIVTRAAAEGFSPATQGYPKKNNYYGIGCTNSGDLEDCTSYSSFEDGVNGFIKIMKKYDTIEEMMGEYAYLGTYWANPGGTGSGGCYYFSSVKPYLSAGRIEELENNRVCDTSDSTKACDKYGNGNCTPTTEEDRTAYQKYQVYDVMVKKGNKIFGEVTPGGMVGLAKFDIRTTKPEWLSAPDSNYYTDTINGSNYFQCVWYAKARAVEILSTMDGADSDKAQEAIDAIYASGAHGSGWYDLAQGDGSMSIFGSSSDINSPRPGAMISWKWNSSGCIAYNGYDCTEYGGTQTNYGHVGIIESVDYENSKVIVSDGWHICSDWSSTSCFGFRSKEYDISYLEDFGGNYIFIGYVYIADYVGG